MVNHAADLENNVLRFLTEWLKGTKKNRNMLERLKAKVDKEEGLEPPEDNGGQQQTGEFNIDNLPQPQVNNEEVPQEEVQQEVPQEEEVVETKTTEEQELEQKAGEEGTAPSNKADDLWSD